MVLNALKNEILEIHHFFWINPRLSLEEFSLELLCTKEIVPMKIVDCMFCGVQGNKNLIEQQRLFLETVSLLTRNDPHWGGGRYPMDDRLSPGQVKQRLSA